MSFTIVKELDSLITVFLFFTDTMSFFFSNSDLPRLAELHPGAMVKVIGTCDGLMMNVILNHSILKSVDP